MEWVICFYIFLLIIYVWDEYERCEILELALWLYVFIYHLYVCYGTLNFFKNYQSVVIHHGKEFHFVRRGCEVLISIFIFDWFCLVVSNQCYFQRICYRQRWFLNKFSNAGNENHARMSQNSYTLSLCKCTNLEILPLVTIHQYMVDNDCLTCNFYNLTSKLLNCWYG